MMSKYRILSLVLLVFTFASCHTDDGFSSRLLFGEYWSIVGMVLVAIFTGLAYLIVRLMAHGIKEAGVYEYEIEETRYGTRTYKDNWGLPTHTVDFEERVGTGEYDTYRITKQEEQYSIIKHNLDIQAGRTCACLLSIAFLILTNSEQNAEINGTLALTGLIMGITTIIIYLYCNETKNIYSPIVLALASDTAKYLRYTYIFGFALFFVCVCIGDEGFMALGAGLLYLFKSIFGIGYGVATLLDLWLNLSNFAFGAITAVVSIPVFTGLFKVLYKWTDNIIATCVFLFLINLICYVPCSFAY